ncbi:hypothetical protein BGZ99_009162 [Dissophora globulifera]|uniref:Cystinosin n=1 Tax=Dissophora globulifera TaxID=979702 RepID=A0A9P6RA53_9FUNG|nr:hypothetical protein BGZ99_009162 [Dissophora globulifera]
MDPVDATAQEGFGSLLSHVIGWVYFLAWSASFYPQVVLNWRRKSVHGLSMDFIYLNVLGFLCYSVFNLSFFFSEEVQEEYRKRNNGQDNLVRANDVFFAVHALVLSSVTLLQTFIYERNEHQTISRPTKFLISISIIGAGIVLGSAISGTSQWIDCLYYLSYIKLGVSFVKYCPQAYLNYLSQSTVGWSIHNILLDFTGGILSIAQLILDAYISGDWSGISGDPVKLGLGSLSILFDLVFMTQHYVLYRNREDQYAPLSTAENDNGERKRRWLLLPNHKNHHHSDYMSTAHGDNQRCSPVVKDLEVGASEAPSSSRH